MCVIPCESIRVMKPFRLSIDDVQILIPDREKYESRVRIQVTQQMASIDSHKAVILSRRLKIGQCTIYIYIYIYIYISSLVSYIV
jgi:hypothetical protein